MIRGLLVFAGFVAAWFALVAATGVPHYILPSPQRVVAAFADNAGFILENAAITFLEIVLGMIVGLIAGLSCALALATSRVLRAWMLPLIVASQAIPVFAIAPLLVLWLGYGIASKIVAAALIIFFPVASAFYDGLARTNAGFLDLARTMGATKPRILLRLRFPAALPALASGIRVAAAIAPIGAVIGEWVGASAGLGFVMLQSNAQMRVDLMFAALIVLAAFALLFYAAIDRLMAALVPWDPKRIDR
jgi:putative hydroxymethylpyrimidine transport system permease protein